MRTWFRLLVDFGGLVRSRNTGFEDVEAKGRMFGTSAMWYIYTLGRQPLKFLRVCFDTSGFLVTMASNYALRIWHTVCFQEGLLFSHGLDFVLWQSRVGNLLWHMYVCCQENASACNCNMKKFGSVIAGTSNLLPTHDLPVPNPRFARDSPFSKWFWNALDCLITFSVVSCVWDGVRHQRRAVSRAARHWWNTRPI